MFILVTMTSEKLNSQKAAEREENILKNQEYNLIVLPGFRFYFYENEHVSLICCIAENVECFTP